MQRKIVLDNGIRLVLNHMPHMASAAIGIWVSTGSRNETRNLSGMSHFLEHMIFKGTSLRSGRKIKEEIEGRGGSLNGFTSEEMTCYLAKVSRQHIDIALEVLTDMVLHARMSQRDIERERSVIIEEIKMYRDLPNHRVHDILSELMWTNHPLGFPIAGDIESVSSIKRQDILNYKNANYIPQNIVVVLCGNLDFDEVTRKVINLFRIEIKAMPLATPGFKNAQSRPQVKLFYKDTEQSHLSMGVHTFGRMHEDRYVLSLLHIILGANMSSRLFENVREKKGLAYEIATEVKRHKETGAFIVNAGIEHKKIKEAMALITKELKKIKDKLVPEGELKRAKEYFKVQLLLTLEDTQDHMLWLGEHMIASGKLPNKEHIIKKVEAVSSRGLQRVARSIFDNKNLNLALIGPVRNREKKEIERELSL